jgi:quercetin dioxygenase-like cupin family protein
MFNRPDDQQYRELIPGVSLKTMAHGERTLLGEFLISKGAVIPVHDHPQEQTGYLVSGRIQFTVDGRQEVFEPGSAWCLPAGTPHGATALEECVLVEVFSPVREDYLP